MSADLSEFVSKLKRQGSNLCLPLGRSLGEALSHFGFRHDQDVLVRFGPEKLEIRPRNTPREIQEKSKVAVEELKAIEAQVQAWVRELPPVCGDDHEGPLTPEGELLGTLECLLSDDLGPAIQKLESVLRLRTEPAAARMAEAERKPDRPQSPPDPRPSRA